MARIRSVHPGLFTDERFVELSTDAQIFLVGLYTQADDQGVFQWKTGTLRMHLRPTKDGSVDGLLDELAAGKFITSYEIEGRKYGAIRNFREFQKPKKPNSTHPTTLDIRTYVGLEKRKAEQGSPSSESSSEPVGNQFGNPPSEGKGGGSREDGGGKGKGEEVAARLNSEIKSILDEIEPFLNSPLPIVGRDIRPWLEAGTPRELIIETIRAVTERERAKKPDWYPKGLKYFNGSIEEARAKASQPPSASFEPASPETQRGILETKAKLLNAGTRFAGTTAEDVSEMIRLGLTTVDKAKALGFAA